ncbi:MAG TPA: hypothetical protein VLI39_07650 [Sedimentisphaerales bacterium]|nr:hypothetical protein [Sedimentisphaerales bacterium]
MPTIISTGSGNWNSTTPDAPWPSGIVPDNTKDVEVEKNHTITLTSTDCVCKSLTLRNGTTTGNVGAILQATGGSSWTLTIQEGIATTAVTTANYMSSFNLDMTSDNTKIGTLVLNNANSTSDGTAATIAYLKGNYQLKGFARKRWCLINSALVANTTKSVVVSDATGWAVGDRLCFECTEGYATTLSALKLDWVTIATITPGSGTTATVTWTDGAGTGGAVKYAHASGCRVGNFSSNLIVKAGTDYYRAAIKINNISSAGANTPCNISDVCFYRVRQSGYPQYPLTIEYGSGQYYRGPTSCAFYDCGGNNSLIFLNYAHASGAVSGGPGVSWCISGTHANTEYSNLFYTADTGNTYQFGDISDCTVFSGSGAIFDLAVPQNVVRCSISGNIATGASASASILFRPGAAGASATDCKLFSNRTHGIASWGSNSATRCSFGSSAFANALNEDESGGGGNYGCVRMVWYSTLDTLDCNFPSSARYDMNSTTPGGSDFTQCKVIVGNKNGDASVQEVYNLHSRTVPVLQRDTATVTRSTSSIRFTLNNAAAQTWETEVLAKAGETITILVYVRKSSSPSYGSSTLPSVTISGLGITPVVTTMDSGTAADAWELLTCQATNSGSADGLLTVTFTAQSATAGAKAYFSGMPFPPFVSRARHYGKVFNETNAAVTTDTLSSASEATAAAYSGMTLTWGSSSSTAITTSQTFQKLYDYHQSQAVLNVGSALALTGAGAAGSPALFAAGNVTISDGAVLNGAGSIAMGSYTLSTEFAGGVNYTYTGGTWSQLTTVPTVSGGQLNLGAAGTYAFTSAAAMILSMTPAAPGTYVLSGCTLTGEQDLRNTTAHAITVEVPSGTDYTTDNNTGGAITVSEPQLYQSVVLSGAVSGSRVQLYDTENDEELYNGTPSFPYTWTDPDPATVDRDIRIRVAKVSGATAKQFLEAAIGTCGTTEETAVLPYLVSQEDDDVYNLNAIDGSTVTGLEIDDSIDRVKMNISGGATTWGRIYAYGVYWLGTEDGIRDDGAFIEAPDPANYLFTNFQLRNIHASLPVTITGGYGRDATTGSVADIIDTASSTAPIFPEPDHVVAYAVGSALTGSQDAKLTAIESAVAAYLDAKISDTALQTSVDELPSASDNAAAQLAALIGDGTLTLAEAVRIILAEAAGRSSGHPTSPKYRNLANTKDVISGTLDEDGNRTSVTVNP